MGDKRLFMRLASGHKPSCSMSFDGPEPEAVADPAELARTLGDDALARYAADCRPIYDDLRRVVGQLAGLSILLRLTASREVAGLAELDACRARWREAGERLAALDAPAAAARHRRQLDACRHFCGLVMGTFSEAFDESRADEADLMIKRAYAHLSAASADRAGLQMVDFANACCSCMH